jgi:hypothetical protein
MRAIAGWFVLSVMLLSGARPRRDHVAIVIGAIAARRG